MDSLSVTSTNDAASTGPRAWAIPVLTGSRHPVNGIHVHQVEIALALTTPAELGAALMVVSRGLAGSSRDIVVGFAGRADRIHFDDDHHDDPSAKSWRWLLDRTEGSKETADIPLSAIVLNSPATTVDDLTNCPIAAIIHADRLFVYTDKSRISEALSLVITQQIKQTLSYFSSHPLESFLIPPSSYLSKDLLSYYSPPANLLNRQCPLVFESVKRHAIERPNAIAVEWYPAITAGTEPDSLTFKVLDEKSSQLAHFLSDSGVGLADKVAICGTRDLDFHVSLLGIMKSGACYVPIEYELPIERKLYVVHNSNAKFVICPPEEASNFGSQAIVISHPSIAKKLQYFPTSDPGVARVDSLAYLLYTSGTTGLPKGCLLNHEGLSKAIQDFTTFVPTGIVSPATDKQLGLASIAFDVHLGEILATWHLGARIVNAPRKLILQDLAHAIITMGITHTALVPSLIEATLGPYWDDSDPTKANLPLKVITSGGEKITDAILDRFTTHPSIRIINFYGPTEVTIGCTGRTMSFSDVKENIGNPFPSVRAFVVDENMNLVPRGVAGELVVEGSMVGVGYHELSDLTSKTFLEWPDAGCRAYKTGDLVRMMPDDTIHIIGRADSQIKLHGVRIESEGISNVLRGALSASLSILASNSPVEVTTLIAVNPSPSLRKEKLVSFVSWSGIAANERKARGSPSILPAGRTRRKVLRLLEEAAERELAVYMRPSFIIPIDFMPLTMNNKTDRRGLEALYQSLDVTLLSELKDIDKVSSTEAEHWLRDIIRDASVNRMPDLSGTREASKVRGGILISETLAITPSDLRFLDNYGIDSVAKIALSLLVRAYSGTESSDVVCGEVHISDNVVDGTALPFRIEFPSAKRGTWQDLLTLLDNSSQEADELHRSKALSYSMVKNSVVGDEGTEDGCVFPAVVIRSSTESPDLSLQHSSMSSGGIVLELLRGAATSLAVQLIKRSNHLDLMVISDTWGMSSESATIFAKQFLVIVGLILSANGQGFVCDGSSFARQFPDELLSVYGVEDPEEDVLVTSYVKKHVDAGKGDSVVVEWFDGIPSATPPTQILSTSKTTISSDNHPPHQMLTPTTELTYASLESLSNRLARYLVKVCGMKPEDRVAICMPRNVAFHVSFLAVAKGGGCYVPIDPELPEERKQFIASDSDALFVLCSDPDQACIFGSGAIMFDPLCANQVEVWRSQDENSFDLATPDGLAYLLYTSGTSGAPKGCLCTHRGLSAAVRHLSSFWGDTLDVQRDRHLATSSIAFDVHILEFLAVWKHGYRICTAHRSELLEKIGSAITGMGITHVNFVPSLIEAVIVPLGGNVPLKFIGSGGEKLSDTIIEWWADIHNVRLVNFYGPSEATIGCSASILTLSGVKSNIGKTVPGCSAFVVDDEMNLVIRGAPGELVIDGVLVGRGYLKRPELTSKVFRSWPPEKAMPWSYRTGDIVRMMPDSSLEILGRADSQIKLRGVRIESEGISNILRLGSPVPIYVSTALARHPEIGADQLVCFISTGQAENVTEKRSKTPSLDHGAASIVKKLEAVCIKELAVYMRPAHIVPITFLPLSNVGKVDNKALLRFFQNTSLESITALKRGNATSRPPGAIELRVMDLVSRHTGITLSQLSWATHLFECGLDSLRLISFAADLRFEWKQIAISVGQIMANPTIEGVASLIQRKPSESSHQFDFNTFRQQISGEVGMLFGHDEVEAIFPPFPVQEGVLYRSMGSQDSVLYVQHIILECNQNMSPDSIQNGWNLAMQRHEILRTAFVFTSEGLAQVVLRPEATNLPWSDHWAPTDDFAAWFNIHEADKIAKEINRCMTTPLFRLGHFRDSRSSRFITLSIHHAIYDGISLPLLLKDVEKLYKGSSSGVPLPMKATLSQVLSIDLHQAEIFWRKKFERYAFSRSLAGTTEGKNSTRLTHTVTARLATLEKGASALHVTLQTLMLGAFAIVLGEDLLHSRDVTFGVIRSGRSGALDRIDVAVYPLVSVLPVRVQLSTQSAGNFLQSVQDDIITALPYEHTPLRRIQGWISPGRSMFDVVFSYVVKGHPLALNTELWQMTENRLPHPEFNLAVEIVCNKDDDILDVTAVLTDNAFSSDLIGSMLKRVEDIVMGIIHKNNIMELGGVKLEQPAEDINKSLIPPQVNGIVVDEALEDKLRSIVGEFLNLKQSIIAPSYSLVSLGLDSLKAISLARKLQENHFPFTAVELMKEPTIRAIAQLHAKDGVRGARLADARRLINNERERLRNSVATYVKGYGEDDRVEAFPVTGLQAGMLTQTIHSGGTLYAHTFPLRLRQMVDVSSLNHSWLRTLTMPMMSILRTSFHFDMELGEWIQVVHSRPYFDWTTEEVQSSADISQRISIWSSTLRLDSEEKFAKPPIRFRLFFKEGDLSPLLVLWLHHAVYDGVSLQRLLHVVSEVYQQGTITQALAFTDVVGQILFEERNGTSFWAEALSGITSNHLLGSPRSTVLGTRSWRVIHQIESLDVKVLERTCRRFDVTPQSIGQAVWSKLLAIISHSLDVTFGQVISGRSIPNSEDVIGPVLNTIPCRVQLSPEITNRSLIKSIHRNNIAASSWQHVSIRSIQRVLGVPLFDTLFVFQSNPTVDDDAPWDVEILGDVDVHSQYLLNLELHQFSDRLVIGGSCNSETMPLTAFEDLLRRFEAILASTIKYPDRRVAEDCPEIASGTINHNRSTSTEPDSLTSFNYNAPTLPEGRQERLLREILASAITIPMELIKSNSSLVALGIDSITAIQISAKCRKAGLQITAADFSACRNVDDVLQTLLRKEGGSKVPVAEPSTQPSASSNVGIYDRLGLIDAVGVVTPGMEWLVGAWQKSGRSRFQHAFAFRCTNGRVDARILMNAWRDLTRRHSVLRSTVVQDGTGPMEMVTFSALEWQPSWLERLAETEDDVKALISEWVTNPMPTSLPPVKAGFLRTSSHDYLVIYLHHFQYDAWSLQVLLHDLSQLYKGEVPLSSNDPRPFLGFTVSARSTHRSEQKSYWKQHLDTSTLITSMLPKLQENTSSASRTNFIQMDAIKNASSLLLRCQTRAIPIRSLLLAAWARVQSRHSKSESTVTFGLWTSGRTADVPDIENLAFPCMNVLPFQVPVLNGLEAVSQIDDLLRKRSPIIDHSWLVDIGEWIGFTHQPFMNVYVNILPFPQVADKNNGGEEQLFEPVPVPYFIPPTPPECRSTIASPLVTDLIQDDCFIEIGTDPATDSIFFAVECHPSIFSYDDASRLSEEWVREVEATLT